MMKLIPLVADSIGSHSIGLGAKFPLVSIPHFRMKFRNAEHAHVPVLRLLWVHPYTGLPVVTAIMVAAAVTPWCLRNSADGGGEVAW